MAEERSSLRHKLALYSWLSGAACLIPVPLLDDWALKRVRRRMTRELLREAGLEAGPEQAALLAEGDTSIAGGCVAVLGLPLRVIFAILGKIFRKILFLLAIKQASDESIRTMLHGFLLEDALETGVLNQEVFSAGSAANHVSSRIYWAIDAAIREIDPRPLRTSVRNLFRGQRQELSQTSNELAFEARQQKRAGNSGQTDQFEETPRLKQETAADQLGSLFWSNPDYLERLRARFRIRLQSDVPLARE